MSSLLKGGSSHTELALAMREFSLVGKWVEVVRDGYIFGLRLMRYNYHRREEAINAEVAQRKSTVLIRRGSRFRNSLSVPIFISRWCNGSIAVSKTVGWGSSPYRDANFKKEAYA